MECWGEAGCDLGGYFCVEIKKSLHIDNEDPNMLKTTSRQ